MKINIRNTTLSNWILIFITIIGFGVTWYITISSVNYSSRVDAYERFLSSYYSYFSLNSIKDEYEKIFSESIEIDIYYSGPLESRYYRQPMESIYEASGYDIGLENRDRLRHCYYDILIGCLGPSWDYHNEYKVFLERAVAQTQYDSLNEAYRISYRNFVEDTYQDRLFIDDKIYEEVLDRANRIFTTGDYLFMHCENERGRNRNGTLKPGCKVDWRRLDNHGFLDKKILETLRKKI